MDVFIHPAAIVESESVGSGSRIWAYSHVLAGATVGANCNIGDHCYIESGAMVGSDVTLKNGNMIWDGVTLEDGVFLGPGAILMNDLRPRSPRHAAAAGARYDDDTWLAKTLVRRGSTIGAGAMILPGLTVGEFAFVAAGAIVTRNVPSHALVAGQPAQVRGWVCCCGQDLTFEDASSVTGRCRTCGSVTRVEDRSAETNAHTTE